MFCLSRTLPVLGLLVVAATLFSPVEAAVGLKLYVDEIDTAVGTRVTYGYDRDAECDLGTCQDMSGCQRHYQCAGIGDGLCHYTACTSDFRLCDDGTTICAANSDCTGIDTGTCNAHPCAPPDRMCGMKVEDLTAGAPLDQTIWQLVCDPVTLPSGTDCQVGSVLPATTVSWDFSGFNTTTHSDLVGTATGFAEIETVEFETGGDNSGDCGFDPGDAYPGRTLNREDKNYTDTTNLVPTLNSIEREDGPTTATIWMRGVVRFEGIVPPSGNLGAGESRLCHDPDVDSRTEVPLWHFPNQDGSRYYMELGDAVWDHSPFDCESIILAPSPGAQARVSTDPAGNPLVGKQTGEVMNEGLVKLPSGHQFHALVTRNIIEYDVRAIICIFDGGYVRTALYLWEVPHLGTVARLQSDKIAPDRRFCEDSTTFCASALDCQGIGGGTCNPATPGEYVYTHLSEIDIKFGLFPPLTLNAGTVTAGTIDVSWNPGDVTTHIDGYRVYWSEESGGECSTGGEDCTDDHPGIGGFCTAGKTCCGTVGAMCDSYGFDSVNDPGQVAFNAGCTLAPGDTECATISGLDPGTTYYVTVTSMDDYTNPASGVTTTYESALYPTQIPAVPVDLPIEVSAATSGGADAGAVPDGDNRPGTQLTASKSGSMVTLSWGASCQAGDTDYEVYEGALGSFAGHEPETCSTLNMTTWGPFLPDSGDRFFVVVPRTASAEGSYGLDSSNVERAVSPSNCLTQSIGAPVCP